MSTRKFSGHNMEDNKRMNAMFLSIKDVVIKMNVDFVKYQEYLSAYFSRVLLPHDTGSFDIQINLKWIREPLNGYIDDVKGVGQLIQIGGNTLTAEGRVIVMRKIQRRLKVIYDIVHRDGKLEVDIIMRKKPFMDFFQNGPFSRSQDEWFFALTYYFLYYPIFWYLQRHRSTYVLHASALSFNNKGIVICGLEGIGKTSLALMFLQEKGAEFLSDNLILFDKDQMYPCYELLRLHHSPDNPLLEDKFEKINKIKILKDFYAPKFKLQNNGMHADIMVFPEFSNKFFVKKISVDEAVNRADALSYVASELNNYLEYRNLYDLLEVGKVFYGGSFAPSKDVLRSALSSAICYEVGMPKKDGLMHNFERLKESICNV